MHRPFELGQGPDVAGRHLEVGLLLESLGGDHVPHVVDDVLALGGDLHLHHRVVEQVAAVVGRGGAHVVGGAQRHQLHGRQAAVGVGEQRLHVGEVGDRHAVEAAVGGVVEGLVEGVGADADGGPAQVELADVDRVEGGVPGGVAPQQDVFRAHFVVGQFVLGHEVLAVHHVLQAGEAGPGGVGGEEAPLAGVGHLAEGGEERGLVPVADVVLAPIGPPGAVAGRSQGHLGGVQVGPVRLLRQSVGEDAPLLQQAARLVFHGLVAAHPDGPQAEHADLPGVPVGEAVEAQDLGELADAPGVPTAVGGAVARRGAHGGEEALLPGELQEVAVPHRRPVVLLHLLQALGFEERDGAAHHLGRPLVGVAAVEVAGIEEDHLWAPGCGLGLPCRLPIGAGA